jgi:hypothetical protein
LLGGVLVPLRLASLRQVDSLKELPHRRLFKLLTTPTIMITQMGVFQASISSCLTKRVQEYTRRTSWSHSCIQFYSLLKCDKLLHWLSETFSVIFFQNLFQLAQLSFMMSDTRLGLSLQSERQAQIKKTQEQSLQLLFHLIACNLGRLSKLSSETNSTCKLTVLHVEPHVISKHKRMRIIPCYFLTELHDVRFILL